MEANRLIYTAFPYHLLQWFAYRPVVQMGKHKIVLLKRAITLDYLQGDVQQLHLERYTRLVTLGNNPLLAVHLHNAVGGQFLDVHEREGGEARKKHQSKGDRNKENQTQPVVNKRFCSRLPLQPNSRERQDNARFPLPSHYLFRNLPEA